MTDDGRVLTCTIGVPAPQTEPPGAFHMSYALFDLDLESRTLTRLTELQGTRA